MSGIHRKRRRMTSDGKFSELKFKTNEQAPDKNEPTTSKSTVQPIQLIYNQLDDQSSSDDNENSEKTSLANCRLRHGLNNDCLYEIFKFLNVYDLIQLCELDIFFQKLIKNWVIGKKLINFTQMNPCWTTNQIFRTFGKNMRKIKIGEENTSGSFELFLTFIIQYCAVGGLTDLELRFSTPTASTTIMDRSMPYFANLRKLVLYDNYSRVSYKEFLASIATTSTNLTHLQLEGVDVSDKWLLNGGMENLREVRMHTSRMHSINIKYNVNEMVEFFRSKQQLELFSYVGEDEITPVLECLTEYCPKLTTLVCFMLNHVTDVMSNFRIQNQYSFTRNLGNVKTIGLTSYTQCGSDLYYPLVKIAAQNRIEHLKIYINRDKAIQLDENYRKHYSQTDFGHFTSLKSIEIQLGADHYDCHLNTEYICEIMSKLTNVEKLTVMSEPTILDINKAIDMAPNLNVLNIAFVKMKYLPVEMRKIVRSIRARREQQILGGQENPTPFHLIVNGDQWREVQVYKDAKVILTLTIEHNHKTKLFKVTGA